jgi:hypothetical protein
MAHGSHLTRTQEISDELGFLPIVVFEKIATLRFYS